MIDLRIALGRGLRGMLVGDPDPQPPVDLASPGDPGLFGPDSVTWKVHADIAMLVGGLRSLMLQTLHPLAMAGVAQHSAYRTDPLGRLQRTGHYIGTTTYGSTAEALAAIEVVRKIHARVQGVASDGRPYSALDPHLLAWVHVTEVDSFLRSYRRFGPRLLRADEPDRYVAEMAEVAERLGVVDAPRSTAELDERVDAYRPELEVTTECREAIRFLFLTPLPLPARAPYGVLLAAGVGMLPRWARRMLGLPLVPGTEPLVVRPAATVVLRVMGWALHPTAQRRGAEERLAS